jgi:starch synthase
MKKKIWVFTFEYNGIIKVGGLGEVPPNQSRNIVKDPNFELTVFMPSHGMEEKVRDKLGLKDMGLRFSGSMSLGALGMSVMSPIAMGSLSKFGISPRADYYEIGFERGVLDGVNIVLIKGMNELASKILGDPVVYSTLNLNGKMGLFSFAIKHYTNYLLEKDPGELPQLVHVHDHHPLCGFIAMKQELNKKGRDVSSVIMMHLLTWPRRSLPFIYACGVEDRPIEINIAGHKVSMSINDIFYMAKGNDYQDPTLEKFGCIICDKVLSVSNSYLHSDVLTNCGGELISHKSDFTWNGCDWRFDQMVKGVCTRFKEYFDERSTQTEFRKIFLTKLLGDLPDNEPFIDSQIIRDVIKEQFTEPPYHQDGKVDSFKEDGPMILITGRVSNQKGLDTFIHAMPYVVEKFPDVRIVMLLIPSEFDVSLMRYLCYEAKKYPDNFRVVFGPCRSIFFLAHLASDVYCSPSHWEPFGINALEAMASRIPVVATYVGGLQESIIHLEDNPDAGTGLLCPVRDSESLKYALTSLLSTMMITEYISVRNLPRDNPRVNDFYSNIVHYRLKSKVEADPLFAKQIRSSCEHRVDSLFRWDKVTEKLRDIYNDLIGH